MNILSIINSVYFWTLLIVCFGILVANESLAQGTGFAVSGQGRGSQADAKQAAQITALEAENQDRLAETNQNSADIADHENRISSNETRLGDVETTCTDDQKLRWDGSSWNCISETDPTVGAHGRSPAPPDCHDTNAKLLWDGSANQWHCEPDITLSTPPTCSGGSRALQWNGSSWSCQTLIRECRACIRIGGNRNQDGDKVCTPYSSAGNQEYSGLGSDWAMANDGPYGGGKYKVGVWIQCR